jgi:hypothetical protein
LELNTGNSIGTEQIENCIEHGLFSFPHQQTEKGFILAWYRRDRNEMSAIPMEVDRINQYISRADWEVRENSNACDSLQG